MKIILNDKEKDISHLVTPTVGQLVVNEGIKQQGTAIAVNNRIVRKAVWDTTILNEGDEVSVVTIAYGG